MPEPFLIQTSRESLIMVSGSSPSPFGGRLKAAWIGLGAMIGALVVLGLLLLGLNFSVAIPEQTVVLMAITPNDASSVLNDEVRNALPSVWKQALEGTSSWPVILGAAPSETGWKTFAIVPRWRDGSFLAPNIHGHSGLVSLITQESALASQKKVTYLHEMPRPKSRASLWVNLLPMLKANHSFSEENWKIEPFTAELSKKGIQTSLSLPTKLSDTTITQADIAINGLDKLKSPIDWWLKTIPLGDVSIADQLITFKTVNLWTNDQGGITKKEAYFTQKPTPDQARMLLAGLGVVQKNDMALPDGTIAKERLALAPEPEQLFKTFETDRFGTVQMNEERLLVGDLSQPTSTNATACVAHPILRLSGLTVRRMLATLTGTALEHLPAIQLGEDRGRLILCAE